VKGYVDLTAVSVHLRRRMASIRGCHASARGTALATANYRHARTSRLCSDGELVRERLSAWSARCFGDRLSIARGIALSLPSHSESVSQDETLVGQCLAGKLGRGV